jgi:ACS family hexuronate transporter-like MFS transporter
MSDRWDRWVPAFAMLLVSLVSYVDRTTLALLAPTILKETHLNGEQYGFIISAFSIAYMLSNPLWGWILDHAGLRRGMTAAVACWTAASAAHAFATGFWSFGAARAALGFGEGATFPGGLRAVVQTLPPEQRGRGLAVAYSGGSLGAVIAPLIVTPIFLWRGWRAAFWFTGLIGAAWLALWAVVGRRPDIRKPEAGAPSKIPGPRFSDPRLWAFMCAYALGALPLGFVLYSASLYLAHPLECPQALIGKLLWIPPLGWEAGYFVWGWISDRAFRRGEPRERSLRRTLTFCVVLNLAFASVPWLPNLAAVMAAMFLAMFVASGFVVLSVGYATHVYSADHAGLIAGAGAGSWSLMVALTMPLFGRLFDQHRYSAAFLIATAIPIAGYLGWLCLRRGSSLMPHAEPFRSAPAR